MKKIVLFAFLASLALLPLTALADTHTEAANKAAASADAAGKAATDMANKAAECHSKCAHDKDVKACSDKCTAEMKAGHEKTMGHANAATGHANAAAAAAGAAAKH